MKIHSEIEMRCTSDYDYMIIISSSISFLQPSMFCCLQRFDICPLLLLQLCTLCPHILWPAALHMQQKAVANCVWMLVVKIEGIERIY